MKRAFLAATFLVSAATTALANPSVFPTGTTIYDPARAHNSFISFSADGATHLIDMNGNEVHRWPYPGLPGAVIDPALVKGEKGRVLLQTSRNDDPRGGIFTNRTVAELDWNNRIVWEWGTQAPGGSARQNHDWARLPNGNTLLLVTRSHIIKELGTKEVGDQGIYEVSPNGNIVWSWFAGDHIKEFGFSPAGLEYLRNRIARNPVEPYGYLEINTLQRVGENKWFDSGDKRFAPDNLIINSRKGNVILIISRETGQVVWRLGPDYPGSEFVQDRRIGEKTLPRPVDQLSGEHNPHIIPKGLPGAGNMLIFDNQGGAGFPHAALGIYAGSRILEINPQTKEIVWQYTGESSGRPPASFFSSFISNSQRLPNGNTLITEGINGRLFQVTPDGDIVWEYVNPYPDVSTRNGKRFVNHSVYRAQAVSYDWIPAGTPRQEKAVDPGERLR